WLRKKHGRGKYWEGLDPQELYTGPYYVAPEGILTNQAMADWHDKRDGQWIESAPPFNAEFVRTWLLRQNQIVDDYDPDLMYFDDTGLPLGQTGLDAAAHLYNRAIERRGNIDVVLFGKKLEGIQRRAIVEDVERGVLDEIRPDPWQTDTCIGSWHYSRSIYNDNAYKTTKLPPPGMFSEDKLKPFTAEDVRFTRKGETLYAILLDWPQAESAIQSLGSNALPGAVIERIDLLGGPQLQFRRDADALRVTLPPAADGAFVPALRINGRGLT